jgi:hypothetical protein
MRFMHLFMFSDFMQVLHIKGRHPKKNEYFPKHILFTTIYLLHKYKLNHNNYSEQKVNMNNFVQAKKCHMNMHAKIHCMDMHGWL